MLEMSEIIGTKPILMDLLNRKRKDKLYLEVVFVLEKEVDVLKDFMVGLGSYDIRIVEGFHDSIGDKVVWATFLEVEPDFPYEEVIESAREIQGVSDIKFSLLDRADYFEKFFFPLGTEELRLIVLPRNAFLKMTKGIVNTFGTGGASIIFNEGIELGNYIFEMIPDELEEMKEKMNFISNLLKATGWGILDFNGLEVENKTGVVSMRDNAEAMKEHPLQCHFTRGFTTQILRRLLGNSEINMEEIRCEAEGEKSCCFMIR